MRNNQHLIQIRSSLAIAAMAVGLLAGTSLPAAANVHLTTPVLTAAHERAQMVRDFKYAPAYRASTDAPGVSPDYCDLPSAGCESYLSN